jgi:iron complex outermembrane receptor protein
MHHAFILACAMMLAVLSWSTTTAAQAGAAFSGRLLNSLSGDPIPGATVLLEELRRTTTSGADGTFTFTDVPPGTYHLSVRSAGYSSRRAEVSVPQSTAMDIAIDPELHFEEVVSVAAEARSQFEAFQPTSVLAGQELTKDLGPSLGVTLENQPGVASRSFGPAPARPVVRGLDGDRVLILQDGQRLGDLSSQSGDHGVSINPAAATRIEVVRGPATLLYGANAIGGLVNVITDEIPSRPEEGVSGNMTFDLGTAANEAAGAGDVHVGNGTFALHLGGGGRHSSDVTTPEGEIDNSQSRNGFGNVGLAWTGQRHYFGGSYGYDDTKYGIPVVEGGILQLTPRRHSFTLRGGGESLEGVFDSFRATLGVRRYKHDELEGQEVGTAFTNNTAEFELMGSHRAVGRMKGSVGGWLLDRGFSAAGEEALSPPVDQRGFAAFLYEEVTWPHVTFQFGGRLDRTSFTPDSDTDPERDFTNGSGSVGLLLRPAAADDRVTVAVSLAHAVRNPALEELYFFGVHHGNFALEIGDPNLESEKALGFDVSLRARGPRASAEITYFRNDIRDYIYRNEIDHEEFEEREEEFVARFGGREPSGHHHEEGAEEPDHSAEEEELPIVEFVGRDALLQGIEAHADVRLPGGFSTELGLDYVRGQLKDDDTPLPRIPPLRGRVGLRYQVNAFQAGGEAILTSEQDRVAGAEEPTDGYQLLKLFASYSFEAGRATNTITARLDNATDELYRNHLSLIKQYVPEMGRNFKLLYNVSF